MLRLAAAERVDVLPLLLRRTLRTCHTTRTKVKTPKTRWAGSLGKDEGDEGDLAGPVSS